MVKLKTRCKIRALAKVQFITSDHADLTLIILDDKLAELYEIHE